MAISSPCTSPSTAPRPGTAAGPRPGVAWRCSASRMGGWPRTGPRRTTTPDGGSWPTGPPNPWAPPRAFPPGPPRGQPPAPAAGEIARTWLAEPSFAGVAVDDGRAPVIEPASFRVDRLFSAGDTVAFAGAWQGRYLGGLDGAHSPAGGGEVGACGLLTVHGPG